MNNESIYQQIKLHIRGLERVIVAFSGGVDSTLLAYISHQALGENMVAVTVKAPYIPEWEIEEAVQFAAQYKIPHNIIEVDIPASINNNPPDRCYLCKNEIFKTIISYALKNEFKSIIEGSNQDDLSDYRPGMRALKELNIASPFLKFGVTKQVIRDLSQALKLPTWNKPAYACLLSRIPYDTKITAEELNKIAQAEMALRQLDIAGARVRSHGDIARIEVPLPQFSLLLNNKFRSVIIEKIKSCGYLFVTLDLEGYQTGSLNKTLNIKVKDE